MSNEYDCDLTHFRENETGLCLDSAGKGDGRMDNLCSQCAYLVYDEDMEEYVCDVRMDEDDYYRLIQSNYKQCPYYRNGDEYLVVRKQM